MIVKSNNLSSENQSVCFALMYRCMHCDSVVQGSQDDQGNVQCDQCHHPLEDDDEIAYRLEEED